MEKTFLDLNKSKNLYETNNSFCIVSNASREIMLDRISVCDELEFPFCKLVTH